MNNVDGWELNKFLKTYMFLQLQIVKIIFVKQEREGELYFDLESSSRHSLLLSKLISTHTTVLIELFQKIKFLL